MPCPGSPKVGSTARCRSAKNSRPQGVLKQENRMRWFVFVALLAVAGAGEVRAQDAAAGEKVFGVCKACHQVGETAKNNVGPSLNGLFGRKSGTVAGYNYTEA